MKSFFRTIIFLGIGIHYACAQDSAFLVSVKMFDNDQRIFLSGRDGWLFKEGNDLSWAKRELNTTGWRKLKPVELSPKFADKNGKAEGWFRFKFKTDDDLGNIPLSFHRGGWAATDVYLDGNLLASFGNTGVSANIYKEYNPIEKLPVPANIMPGKEHLLAIHFVDYVSPIPPRRLKSEIIGGVRDETYGLPFFIALTGPKYNTYMLGMSRDTLFLRSIYTSVTLLLALLFWLLYFQNAGERKTMLLIAVYSGFSAISNLCRFPLTDPGISFIVFEIIDLIQKLSVWVIVAMTTVITATIFKFQLFRNIKPFLIVYSILGVFCLFSNFYLLFIAINILTGIVFITFILILSWKKLQGAQWALPIGLLLSIFFLALISIPVVHNSTSLRSVFMTGFYFAFPLSLLVYVSMRFREIIMEVRENALQVVLMTEEKKEQALKQQKILEEEVDRQTAEIRTTLDHLKSTQAQLIQSEKMASLGELTAGIAHEIQNPLNFVNNFSEVNRELISELVEEVDKGNTDEVKAIAYDIKDNEEKILHHGKRADAIVKGMLQHSSTSTGTKEPTNINALADEYLRLSYHGLLAKDKTFNAIIKTGFDESIGSISIIPQDIGRVLLNLYNNAFYAVAEKAKQEITGYEPTVYVKTKKEKDLILISVKDNGIGIPQKIIDKIFHPFFTTKPTGQGTGLGLSLSYDIVKAHGGELKVETLPAEAAAQAGKEGEGLPGEQSGSEFVIVLPA